MNYTARSLRLRIPRICVSITADDASEMMDKAEAVLRENPLIELRLDYLKSPLGAMARLRRLTEARPDGILIATCRRTAAGGNFGGSLDEQLEVLRKATEAGCAAVDIEIESAEAMSSEDWEEMRSRAAIVLSSHDFKSTSRLEETFARMRSFNSDFYKVVGTATCLHDNVVMTRFLEEHCSEYAMVGMCMGEQGMLSRILGIRAGGAFTFGSEAAGQGDGSGTADLSRAAGFLPHRADGVGDQGVRHRGRPGFALDVALGDEYGLPAGERERGVSAAARQDAERPAGHGEGPAAGWDQRDHALQAGDCGTPGQQRRA